eukprot:9275492-Lingulodinium_polyedra.AAC.1
MQDYEYAHYVSWPITYATIHRCVVPVQPSNDDFRDYDSVLRYNTLISPKTMVDHACTVWLHARGIH